MFTLHLAYIKLCVKSTLQTGRFIGSLKSIHKLIGVFDKFINKKLVHLSMHQLDI